MSLRTSQREVIGWEEQPRTPTALYNLEVARREISGRQTDMLVVGVDELSVEVKGPGEDV